MKIGFWGVGLMGAPLARRLAEAGYAVLACSREMSKAMSAVGQKGTATTRREDLAECDILFTCLALPEHVRCAVAGPAGLYGRMASGSMHVECSTIDPALAESLEKEAAARGIAYVQAHWAKPPRWRPGAKHRCSWVEKQRTRQEYGRCSKLWACLWMWAVSGPPAL